MVESLGLESGVVRLVEYDARWPELFAAGRQRIRDRCGVLALRLEHVGGTSIPGMCAKPVLDIAAGRPRDTSIGDYVAALADAGYEHRGERGVPGREFFCLGQPRAYSTCTWSRRAVRCGGTMSPSATIYEPMLRAHASMLT